MKCTSCGKELGSQLPREHAQHCEGPLRAYKPAPKSGRSALHLRVLLAAVIVVMVGIGGLFAIQKNRSQRAKLELEQPPDPADVKGAETVVSINPTFRVGDLDRYESNSSGHFDLPGTGPTEYSTREIVTEEVVKIDSKTGRVTLKETTRTLLHLVDGEEIPGTRGKDEVAIYTIDRTGRIAKYKSRDALTDRVQTETPVPRFLMIAPQLKIGKPWDFNIPVDLHTGRFLPLKGTITALAVDGPSETLPRGGIRVKAAASASGLADGQNYGMSTGGTFTIDPGSKVVLLEEDDYDSRQGPYRLTTHTLNKLIESNHLQR